MRIPGADIVIECLLEEGVSHIFGYPGGQVLPIYDAIYRAKKEITHILTSHEQGASHAADGYARASGKTGVCLATSGPGATNLVTGIATAMSDSIPLLAITGNVPLSQVGSDSFQEVDITGVTIPITKHNVMVQDVRDLAETIRFAFRVANEGRPGPVLIDIPYDVQCALCEYERANGRGRKTLPAAKKTTYTPLHETRLDEAADAIDEARYPLIVAGGGAIRSGASAELVS
ncbi:acetolactate synthase large subunit, partial [Oscillospiraceae bacterium OttesenSCG-928-G22]|nr:acetolactate synthase large subunit [Oscillospiraceae bacterium OttesenSCG-928-G22]